MISRAIKVKTVDIENVLRFLKENDLLNRDLRIIKGNGIAYIPVKEYVPDFENVEMDFEEIKKVKDYTDFVDIPEHLKNFLPRSYDRIGDIIIIKLDENLLPYAENIGNALLKFHKNMKTVALDMGVKGELRIRQLKVISGDGLETIHRENGIRIFINPGEVYFSPRLSGERKRVMEQVKNNERIIDMFCGAGPFSLLIGKNRDVEIYAIDKNQRAIEYLKRSMELNGIKNIHPIAGDVRDFIDELPVADRIIMDLPFYSISFIDFALKKSRYGTILHIYSINENEDSVLKELENRFRVLDHGIVHGYSPRENMYFFDLEVKE